MLIAEARWIRDRLGELPDSDFPLVNVGAHNANFRTHVQPWVQQDVFAPLQRRGVQVLHLDIVDEPGVDIVADVTTAEGRAAIAATGARTLLCSNLLEHVADPAPVLAMLLASIPPGGNLLLTGPTAYPHHPNPIDTMFRPDARDMAAQIPADFEIAERADITCRRLAYYDAMRPWGRARIAGRALLPFLRPAGWWQRVKWLNTRTAAYALLVRRPMS
jgi:hypothetical protein